VVTSRSVVVALAVGLLATGAPTATAGTVSLSSTGVLVVTASDSESNAFQITRDHRGATPLYLISDEKFALSTSAPCVKGGVAASTYPGTKAVTCPASAVTKVVAKTKDRNDTLAMKVLLGVFTWPLPAGPPTELVGGSGGDTLNGGGGQDRISGGDGDDLLWGGPGNDTIRGEQGADVLGGHHGDDRLHGGPGVDILLGQDGNDLLDTVDYRAGDQGWCGNGVDRWLRDSGDAPVSNLPHDCERLS
jgi:Ca2+-binding RTX toxin-like protein